MAYRWLQLLDEQHPDLAALAHKLNEMDNFCMPMRDEERRERKRLKKEKKERKRRQKEEERREKIEKESPPSFKLDSTNGGEYKSRKKRRRDGDDLR